MLQLLAPFAPHMADEEDAVVKESARIVEPGPGAVRDDGGEVGLRQNG